MVSYTLLSELGTLPGEHPVDGSLLILRRQVIDYTLAWSDDRADKLARLVDALCTPLLQAGRTLETLVLGYETGFLVVATRDALRLVVVTDKAGPGIDLLAESMHSLLTRHSANILEKNGFNRPAGPVIPVARKTARIEAIPQETPDRPVATRLILGPATDNSESQKPVTLVRPQAAATVTRRPVAARASTIPDIPLESLQGHLVSQLGKVMGQKQAAELVAREAEKQNLTTDTPLDQDKSHRFVRKLLEVVPNRSKRQALIHESLEFLTHHKP